MNAVYHPNSLAQQIAAIDQADSPATLVAAVRSLADCQDVAAIPALIQALGYNNPGAALAAVGGLIALGDCAVAALLNQLDGYNYGARAYAIRALAAIAHPQALDVLLTAAETDFAPSVRRAAIKGLGHLRWTIAPPATVQADQHRIARSLQTISQDPDWAIRYAVVVALQALILGNCQEGIPSEPLSQETVRPLHQCLTTLATTDGDLTVRTRAQLAQAQLSDCLR